MNAKTTSSYKYKAFLSYSHADRQFAKKLHRYLEGFKVPTSLVGTQSTHGTLPEKLGSFFMDREELSSAPDLSNAISFALADSEFLIVLCSPQSMNSRYVNQEVLEFKRLGREDRILCLIVEDVAASADPAEDCFAPTLKFELDDKGELSDQPKEPIAADARQQGDGYRSARLKLVAGLLGIGFDDLRQRELQRHNRRLMGIAGASLAGMVFTIGLSMVALDARDEAQRHREEADKLIGFMLGDLRARLDEVGRLDILDSVVEETIGYFQNLPADELNARTRVQRSAALTQLGQVKDAKGDTAEARQLFRAAHRDLIGMCGELHSATDQACLYELGQVQFWLANGHWFAGENEPAMSGFSDYALTSRRLAELEPENRSYQMELAMSYGNLAALQYRLGNNNSAFELNAQAISIGEELAGKNPSDQQVMLVLADFYSWKGTFLRQSLQLQLWIETISKYLATANKSLQQAAKNTLWLDHAMMAQRSMGQAKNAQGLIPESNEYFLKSIDLAERLVTIEPKNKYWQVELAVTRHNLIKNYLHLGELTNATQLLQVSGKEIAEQLAADTEDVDWQALELSNKIYSLQLSITEEGLAVATQSAPSILAEGQALFANFPNDSSIAFALCELYLTLGELESARGQQARDSKYVAKAAGLLNSELLVNSELRAYWLELAARSQYAAGISDEDNRHLQTLLVAGYKVLLQ